MEKKESTSIAEDIRPGYKSPKARVVFVKAQSVICQSPVPSTETDPEEDILP